MADAAGASGDQRLHQRHHVRPEDKPAYALRPQQALMAGEGQGVDVHGLHVDGQDARRLGGVQEESQAVGMAEGPHLSGGQHRAADVAGVEHHHGTGIGPQQALHSGGVQRAVRRAGDAVEGDALCLKLGQGPHDGVVLHGGDHHMVSGLQKALQEDIQALGDVAGEHHVPAVGAAEQLRQQLAGVQHRLLRLIGLVITAAVDVAATVADIMVHRLRRAGRFGKAGAGIVQIDPLHDSGLLFFLNFYQLTTHLLEKQIFSEDISIIGIGHSVDYGGMV